MSSNPSRLAKKTARKNYGSTDSPTDTGTHLVSTPGLSSGGDPSGAPSTRGPDSSTGISTGSIVCPRNLATKNARKVTTALPSTASRHSTIDDNSDPPSTSSLTLVDTPTGVGTHPLSVAVKVSRTVAFRDLPPASSRRSAVDSDAGVPSSHHGRILASDELTTHRPQDRASAVLSRTDLRNSTHHLGYRFFANFIPSVDRASPYQLYIDKVGEPTFQIVVHRSWDTTDGGLPGDLGYYRPCRSTTITDIPTAEQRKWMNRHVFTELIPDGVTGQRVSRIATGRQSKRTGVEQRERTGGRHLRISKRKSYLVEGKFVSLGPDGSSSSSGDTTDELEESREGQPE
ncbi:hypothetical protein EDD15DRAFT_2453527 [Pisolithus albus]|nr:hypothetical protein EDD15DRAFT_2453527 [Pisolithus albus]